MRAITVAGLLLLACSGSQGNQDSTKAGAPTLPGGTFDFWVNRECSKSSTLPFTAIPDSEYAPVEREARYRVTFSGDATSVSLHSLITDTTTLNAHSSAEPNRYEIDIATGGRFVVTPRSTPMGAELVVYGSGYPIIFCEKGDLLPLE